MKTLGVADMESKFTEGGAHIGGMTLDELAVFFRGEVAKWAKAVKPAGVTAE